MQCERSTLPVDSTARTPYGQNFEEKALPPIPQKRHRWKRFWRSQGTWRASVIGGSIAALVVFIANLSVLLWAEKWPSPSKGIVTMYEGSCQETKKIALWTSLAINLASSLLLGASNHCLQCLSSPTRSEVDKVHAQGRWLDIGIPGIRNLRAVKSVRVALWICLALSSLPLHFLWAASSDDVRSPSLMLECRYNAVVFSSLSTNDYLALLVAPDFLGTGKLNQTPLVGKPLSYINIDPTFIHNLGLNSKNLTRLDNAACVQAYEGDWISEWRTVLLVTNRHSNDSILDIYTSNHRDDLNDPSWLCGFYQAESLRQPGTRTCDLGDLKTHLDNWSIKFWPLSDGLPPCPYDLWECNDARFQTVRIEYCLAEPVEPSCMISISTPLLITVIICNAAKLTCLVYTLLLGDFKPLITVGDAIASFLRSPDERTRECGLLSARNLRYKKSPVNEGKSDNLSHRPSAHLPKKWEWKCEWWFHGASTGRWLWCLLL